jgi:hypothetical protein
MSVDQSLKTEERREWLEFWREALRFILIRAKESKKTSSHSYPCEDEEWILDGVATAVQYMDPEERPEELWRSILDLPAEVHHWPKDFLRAFHRHGLTQDPAPPGFASIRRAMIEHVLTETLEEQARQRWSYYEDVWEALIGIDGFTWHYWVERHRELAERKPTALRAVDKMCGCSRPPPGDIRVLDGVGCCGARPLARGCVVGARAHQRRGRARHRPENRSRVCSIPTQHRLATR